ncbi:MAG: type VI secretion system baseplate subunit TssE [Pedobacter sp.]
MGESILRPSLLDRLIDREPGVSHEPVQSGYTTIKQIRESVIRDLENLLNTRRCIFDAPESCVHVNASVFTYGLKDFMSYNPRSPSVRLQIRQEIERTIALFEPRLRNVSVRIDGAETINRSLRFRISALLVIDPVTEPITFDTYLDINRGEFVIAK